MRTTLTLDDDIAATLKREARMSGRPFKQVVNDTIRRGLSGTAPSTVCESLPTYALGTYSDVVVTKALQTAGELEDEALVAKRTLGK